MDATGFEVLPTLQMLYIPPPKEAAQQAGSGSLNTQAVEGPVETLFGSLPGVVPWNDSQVSLTDVAHVAASMVAVSPKLGLMPTSSLPLEALTFLITTWRSALCLQFPQDLYILPNVSTVKLSIVTVPAPLWLC
jgi:hypothetical protein